MVTGLGRRASGGWQTCVDRHETDQENAEQQQMAVEEPSSLLNGPPSSVRMHFSLKGILPSYVKLLKTKAWKT